MKPDTSAVLDEPIVETEDEPMRDTRIEQLLEEWNLAFTLDQNYALSRLTIHEATQIRIQTHRAPKTTVDQYATHLRHGALFPPLVVTSNHMLVDGNARVEACKAINRKSFPAYIVKFPDFQVAKMMAAALNQLGGDRLSEDEIVTAAEAMLEAGYADEAVARTLGRSVSHVGNVRRDRRYREIAERVGLKDLSMPKPAARSLAGIGHDEPFKAAAELVADVKPAVKDVADLVRKIEKTRSDAEALAVIQQAKVEWKPTGPPPTRRPRNHSKGKTALKQVKALLAIGEAADLVLPDNTEAKQAWQALNVLTTNVLALYASRLELAPEPGQPS